MADQITLDMSKSEPLPVTLDMSKSESLKPGVSFPNLEKSHPYLAAAAELPLRALSGAGGELLSQAGRVAQYTPGLQRLAPTLSRLGAPREGIGEGIGRYVAQGLEFMAPGGAEERAAGMIGGALRSAPGLVRGAAELVPAAVSSGAISALQGTGFGMGAALGAGGGLAGKALERAGAGMATRAAGVTEKQLKYGAKPAEEILGLRGIRPSTIRESAQAAAGDLTEQLERSAEVAGRPEREALSQSFRGAVGGGFESGGAADRQVRELTTQFDKLLEEKGPGTVDLTGVKGSANAAINKAERYADVATNARLGLLKQFVAKIPDRALARDALEYKRSLGNIRDFDMAGAPKPAKAAAGRAYGVLDKALDAAVPEANALDDRIHSLMTIAQPRGSGKAGMGGIIMPWLGEQAVKALGGGPIAGLAGALATIAGTSPAGRIMIGKGMAAAPRFGRMLRAPILQAAQGGEQP